MSITLNATLKTAQDGINHRPIVEIVSSPIATEPPIYGQYLSSDDTNEYSPNIVLLSTGALAGVYVKEDGKTHYICTDTDRGQFTDVELDYVGGIGVAGSVSLTELTDNNIGIVYTSEQGIYYRTITPAGVQVSYGTIATGFGWVSSPHVITLANNTYLLVYAEGTDEPPSEENSYQLTKRTSGNFTSWSAGSTITLSGLEDSGYKNNPHLLQLVSGRIFLHFDYLYLFQNNSEVNNIFSVYSDDNASTWSSPQQITSYTLLGQRALHPTVSQMEDGDLTIIYADEKVARWLITTMDGFPYSDLIPRNLYYNHADQKLYIHSTYNYTTTYIGNWDVDIENWEYERNYDTTTSPAFVKVPGAEYFFCDDSKYTVHISGNLLMVLDHQMETITNYTNKLDTGIPQNIAVNYEVIGDRIGPNKSFIRVTESSSRMWIYYAGAYMFQSAYAVGWIDLLEQPDGITGYYTWNEVIHITNPPNPHVQYARQFSYIEALDCLLFATAQGIYVTNLNGDEVYNFNNVDNAGMPHNGCNQAVYIDGYFYFTFTYYAGQSDRRGLGRVRVADESVQYFEPSWGSASEYSLDNLRIIETTDILMTCGQTGIGGVAVFDTLTNGWEIFNNATVPGMLPDGALEKMWGKGLGYDPVTKTIYAPYLGGLGDATLVVAFSLYGSYSVLKYAEIENPDLTPTCLTFDEYTYRQFEREPSIVYDPDYVLWNLWQHTEDGDEESIMWGSLAGDRNLSDFLVDGSMVVIEWDIEAPTKLRFSLSHGHLFDPQNLLSTYSIFLKKGRKFTVRLGEKISGTEYWQAQGVFYARETKLVYSNEKYPQIDVVAEDLRTLWESNEVVATRWFNGDLPDIVIEDILHSNGDMEYSEMDIPTLTGEHGIYHQYIDMSLDDIIKEFLDHFMYYPFVNVDGVFEPRHLDITKAASHTYTTSIIVEFSPDDSYSTFTNRVVVKGMANAYTEILYDEESVGSVSGTTGWWGKDLEEIVWYSDDHERTCRHPRLEIIQSISEFQTFLNAFASEGHEYLSYEDPNEHYLIITIEAPNLQGAFIGAVAALLATGYMAVTCDGAFGAGSRCGPYILASNICASVVLNILGAIASYNYNIHARPIGHEKRTFQAEANDYKLQDELDGKVITETIDDALCYTVNSCQVVADQELAVVMAQRNRIKYQKISHLQDEIGDIIIVNHPHSGEEVKTFITNLKRTIKIGGETTDDITGWRLI